MNFDYLDLFIQFVGLVRYLVFDISPIITATVALMAVLLINRAFSD